MNAKNFDNLVECQLKRCSDVLTAKDKEYSSPEDRLHNFKRAAALQDISPREALRGMMVKHTVSIYDMCKDNKYYPIEVWDEKITDSINYLILLKGIIEDEESVVVIEGADARNMLDMWRDERFPPINSKK